MATTNSIYKCEICGNVVELVHKGGGQLVCCGKPMTQLEENTVDASTEKHVPIIKENKVIVGETEHPMTEEHYIEWIEATDGKEISKVFLKPEDNPIAEFSFEVESARAYCNLHGLWKSK